ncbi:MAG: alpha/beta hydrolase [Planctomycetota bacterium]
MIFPLAAAGVFLLATLVPAALVAVVLWLLGRPQRRYWRFVGWAHLALLLVHLFVTFPLLLGWFGSRGLGTRHDERSYTGPRIAADGEWLLQDRDSLRAERDAAAAGAAPASESRPFARVQPVRIPGSDGVSLNSWFVPAERQPPRAVVVLVHGLFRSALELERPAAMFRRLGCDVWLLEQRNHGGSDRAPATFGLHESDDLVAAARFVRARSGGGGAPPPMVVFGVSLGTVAAALALPRLDGVAGAVLDAPVDDLVATADRMLSLERSGDRRRFFAVYQPWRSLVLAALELWSGFRMRDVRPTAALQGLPQTLPVLLIGGAHDDKVPVEAVRALYDSLPMPAGTKDVWIVDDAHHGDAWLRHPDRYEARLDAFLRRAVDR